MGGGERERERVRARERERETQMARLYGTEKLGSKAQVLERFRVVGMVRRARKSQGASEDSVTGICEAESTFGPACDLVC